MQTTTQRPAKGTQPVRATPTHLWLPLPGQPWPEQGGIYVGIAAACAWGKSLGNGAHIPTRFEAALLYANVRSHLDTTKWHWTSTPHDNASHAWSCHFSYGGQYYDLKSYEGTAVAVRRLDLYSFNPLY